MVMSGGGGPPGGPIISPLTAGRGALVDGSVVDPTSNQASMLFHSVTMIVPNSTGILATNGTRVEWLNSFTYFAEYGLHLTNGTLGFASQGSAFGAEMRSINSANVYGTYGAVADGVNTLGYLIGHNFGYVGTGLDSQNDDKLTVQANEVVELNSGKIYYDSMDHKGDYRVGDVFYVNQQTGQVTFNAQSINFTAGGNITLDGPTTQTIVDATKVQTGNIRVHDNNIDSLIGPVNFLAQSGSTYLNTDVTVTGNLGITGNTTVKGNIYIGDSPLDLVTIAPRLTQNIYPGLNNTYNIGVKGLTPKVWNVGYLTGVNIDGITQLTNNTISTLTSNNDLKFQAAGTGKVIITSTDVQIDNSLTVGNTLTVNGLTSLRDTTPTGTVTLVGDIGQTGNTYITGLFDNNNIILQGTHSYISVPSVKIQDNVISATATNSDLQFTGNGTGGVIFDNKLKIVDNIISNVWNSAINDTQKSILFSPNGTGNVVLNSTTYLKLPYGDDTNRTLSVVGEIRQNSTNFAYEGHLTTGNESFINVYSTDRKTYVTPELTIGSNDNTLRFVINNAVKATLDSTSLVTPVLQVGDFILSGNTINNPFSNVDTIFEPTGTGVINANGLLFKDNTVTNTLNTPIVLSSTGIGYYKFGGTGAVVLPYGTNGQRRLTPEVGESRYNTEIGYMEVYNGTTWIPAVGTLGAAPLSEVLDIMDEWALILG